MEVVFILLPLAVAVAGVMLALFVWAVKSGQFDDLHTPALRILVDDEPVAEKKPDAAHSKQRS